MELFQKAHWKFRYASGGRLRNYQKGRKARVLTTKDPHHVVFKINKSALKAGLRLPKNFSLLNHLVQKYAARFFVKVEQISIQTDHVHLLIRAGRRSGFQNFFRVVAGQFSQTVTGTHAGGRYEGIRVWKYRPFSRVVKSYKAYVLVRNYIQLNELEVIGKRIYRKKRLAGLSEQEIAELWI